MYTRGGTRVDSNDNESKKRNRRGIELIRSKLRSETFRSILKQDEVVERLQATSRLLNTTQLEA